MEGKLHVVVTGVSTGIGYGILELLVSEGFHVLGSVRKLYDAERLQKRFGDKFTPLQFDVTDEAAILQAVQKAEAALKGHTLHALINNAGIAWPAPLLHQPADDFRRLIEANLMGTFLVTQAFLPLLGTDLSLIGRPGRIINITSVGGKYGAPFMSAYTASKHGVEGMSECLRRELIPYGIDVVIVGPGAVKTPIWEKAQSADVTAYSKTIYAEPLKKFVDHMLTEGQTSNHTPETVARTVLHALCSQPPWTRYAIVNKRLMNWTLPLMLPVRWVDKAMADTFGLKLLKRSGHP